jgi:hypothetical protein
MKVNGLIKNPKWKKILVCTCKGKIDLCDHCKYSKAEQSIPSKDFSIIVNEIKESVGKTIGSKPTTTTTKTKIIKEITLKIGSRDDVIGWEF